MNKVPHVFSPSPSSQPNRQGKWKRRGHQIDKEEDRVAMEKRRQQIECGREYSINKIVWFAFVCS
jgi:hypothetical protein